MLLAEDLRLADQVRNLEVLIEGTGCKQRRLPVVICAHRQNLIQEMREKKKTKRKSIGCLRVVIQQVSVREPRGWCVVELHYRYKRHKRESESACELLRF